MINIDWDSILICFFIFIFFIKDGIWSCGLSMEMDR